MPDAFKVTPENLLSLMRDAWELGARSGVDVFARTVAKHKGVPTPEQFDLALAVRREEDMKFLNDATLEALRQKREH